MGVRAAQGLEAVGCRRGIPRVVSWTARVAGKCSPAAGCGWRVAAIPHRLTVSDAQAIVGSSSAQGLGPRGARTAAAPNGRVGGHCLTAAVSASYGRAREHAESRPEPLVEASGAETPNKLPTRFASNPYCRRPTPLSSDRSPYSRPPRWDERRVWDRMFDTRFLSRLRPSGRA
jgi:hypothetical protein